MADSLMFKILEVVDGLFLFGTYVQPSKKILWMFRLKRIAIFTAFVRPLKPFFLYNSFPRLFTLNHRLTRASDTAYPTRRPPKLVPPAHPAQGSQPLGEG